MHNKARRARPNMIAVPLVPAMRLNFQGVLIWICGDYGADVISRHRQV